MTYDQMFDILDQVRRDNVSDEFFEGMRAAANIFALESLVNISPTYLKSISIEVSMEKNEVVVRLPYRL